MPHSGSPDMGDLKAFLAIVRHGSFTRAAIELGVSTSALSHRLRRLETRLGVRLLNRTSRSVLPTQAGQALASRLNEGFDLINNALGALDTWRHDPVGQLRINVPRDAARLLLAPSTVAFIERYSQITLDVCIDDRPVDIVAGGFDAGIRYLDHVPGDMVALPLTRPLDWVVVGAPELLDLMGRPARPEDLLRYPCIQMRVGDNRQVPWELGNDEALMRLDVTGPVSSNDTEYSIAAAIEGVGLAYCLAWRVEKEVQTGQLEIVLPEWASAGAPFGMYYPGRRQSPPGLRQLIDLLRSRFLPG